MAGTSLSQERFASTIKRWREMRGWSQKRLADELDIGEATIKRWEGDNGLPTPTLRAKLIELTSLDAEQLGLFASRKEDTQRESVSEDVHIQPEGQVVEKDVAILPSPSAKRRSHLPYCLSSRWKRIVLLCLVLVIILGSPLVYLYFRSNMAPEYPGIAGHVFFQSSNLLRDGTNQGIDDEVLIDIHGITNASSGKHYYTWLASEDPEQPAVLLGLLNVRQDNASLFYQGNAQHSNLLDSGARLVITEQDSTSALLGPSLHRHDQRYTATIPNTHPIPTSTDPLSAEYAQYGLLDHLRHLFSSDPTLAQQGIHAGLMNLLESQTNQVAWLAKSARDSWESNARDSMFIKNQIIRIVNILDGTTMLDSPPLPLLVSNRITSFALLPQSGFTITDSYIGHVDMHLRGIRASPGASQAMRDSIPHLLEILVQVTSSLERVREDAEHLLQMHTTQLMSEQAFTLLNDLFTHANTAYAGPSGAFLLLLSAEPLATMDIAPCTETMCP